MVDVFVYAVVTTGVFCLPQCSSRKPRPENVLFFDDWRDALRAGFRPCKRCQPVGGRGEILVLTRACEALGGGLASVSEVAHAHGLSEDALRRLFDQHLGVSPREFRHSLRLNSWKRAVRHGEPPLDAAFGAGYGSARGLYEGVGARLGMTPARFAKRGKDMRLEYESAAHAVGTVLVAGTEHGVSFVALGKDLQAMLKELHRDYPEAEARPIAAGTRWMPAVLRALEHPPTAGEVPLDVHATAFQARVWKALREIPPGETRTYSGMAAELGNPAATRAVARACATNRVSVLIPCHRVVGVSGSLTGYRWGMERKASLLEREQHYVALMAPPEDLPPGCR